MSREKNSGLGLGSCDVGARRDVQRACLSLRSARSKPMDDFRYGGKRRGGIQKDRCATTTKRLDWPGIGSRLGVKRLLQ